MINTFIQPREKITSDSIPSNYIKSKRNKSKTSINEKKVIAIYHLIIFSFPPLIKMYRKQ